MEQENEWNFAHGIKTYELKDKLDDVYFDTSFEGECWGLLLLCLD